MIDSRQRHVKTQGKRYEGIKEGQIASRAPGGRISIKVRSGDGKDQGPWKQGVKRRMPVFFMVPAVQNTF